MAQALTPEDVRNAKPLPGDAVQQLAEGYEIDTERAAANVASKYLGEKYGIRDVYIGVGNVYLISADFNIFDFNVNSETLWCVETFHLAGVEPVDVVYVNPKTEKRVVVYGYSMKADFKRKSLKGHDLMREPEIDHSSDPVEIDPEEYAVSSSAAAIEIAYPLFMKGDDADAEKDKAIRAYPIDAPAGIEDFCEDKEMIWCVEIGIPGKARKISAVAYVHPQTKKCVFVYAKRLKLPNP
jgi:hypothetical protein